MKKIISEFAGTFLLVFFATGSIIVSQEYTFLGPEAPALITGAVVTLLIILLGNISGAHLNPAVTIGFYISGTFQKKEIPGYVLSQFSGAIIASLLLHFMFPSDLNLGNTIPTAPATTSLLFEIILTFILMLVILILSHGYKESGYLIALIVGVIIWIEIKFAGPICGASMNPARSFGPSLISGNFHYMWMYILGPVVGALGAALLFKKIRTQRDIIS